MQPISRDILTQFEAALKKRAVPVSRHADYSKWLRYYLDFRSKYLLSDSKSRGEKIQATLSHASATCILTSTVYSTCPVLYQNRN